MLCWTMSLGQQGVLVKLWGRNIFVGVCGKALKGLRILGEFILTQNTTILMG